MKFYPTPVKYETRSNGGINTSLYSKICTRYKWKGVEKCHL